MEKNKSVNSKNVKKILRVFKKTGWANPFYGDYGDYKEFSLSINAGAWRIKHPDNFKMFCFLSRRSSRDIFSYNNGGLFIPTEITKMVLNNEVKLKELDRAITVIIQSMDKETEEELLKEESREPEQESDPKPLKRPGYIYLIRSGKYHKIGRSRRLGDRITTHRASNPMNIKLVLNKEVGDYIKVETKLHRMFEAKRVKGEWFKLTRKDVITIEQFLT